MNRLKVRYGLDTYNKYDLHLLGNGPSQCMLFMLEWGVIGSRDIVFYDNALASPLLLLNECTFGEAIDERGNGF